CKFVQFAALPSNLLSNGISIFSMENQYKIQYAYVLVHDHVEFYGIKNRIFPKNPVFSFPV
ncbi:MAG: hypothetical protein R2941_22800, partial [Desulfobacterales bacterium]